MQPSRRAFLTGRRPAQTPWAAFRQRLVLTCQGEVLDLGTSSGSGLALLTPTRQADVASARALCAEYGVTLALEGCSSAIDEVGKPQLRVDPSLLNSLSALDAVGSRWQAGPGVCAGELARAGLTQFEDMPSTLTVAAWLANSHHYPTGECATSGLLSAQLLFADGIEESLGPFGTLDTQPLRSATVQRLIPALFQLTGSVDAKTCEENDGWPARYRLDALLPKAPATVNLAQLLLGHGASLAWVNSVILEAPLGVESPTSQRPDKRLAIPTQEVAAAAARLDQRIKSLFDVGRLFPALR